MPSRWSHSCCTTRAWKPVASRSMRIALRVEARVADARPARHHAAQAGHRQAAFPAVLELVGERRDHRIDELGVRHRLGVGIARVALDAEDHHAQRHADLRRGEPGAVLRLHRVAHVGQQRVQLAACRRRATSARALRAGAGRPCAARRGSWRVLPVDQRNDVIEQRAHLVHGRFEHPRDAFHRDLRRRCRRGRRRG